MFFAFGNRFFMQLASLSIIQLSVYACFWGIPLVIDQVCPGLSRYLLPLGRFFDPYYLPPFSFDTGQVPEHINGSAAAPGLQWNLILDKEGTLSKAPCREES